MQTVPTMPPVHCDSFIPQNSPQSDPYRAMPVGDLEAAREARQEQVTYWKSLNLRQDFKDKEWMKDHIKAAGLRVPYYLEPATTHRLRSFLHKAGIPNGATREAIGTTIGVYLGCNRDLPLWAALALVIEATGRFTDKVSGMSQEVMV